MAYGINDYNTTCGSQTAANALNRIETPLESIVSRLSTLKSRLISVTHRATSASAMILGPIGGGDSSNGKPTAVPISIMDYLNEIEEEIGRIENALLRLT